ncbi:hypothetical protein HZZ00_11040 [Streptomyces sp. NEAU-sy36]|uniref:hypothetical protein n=1 Tax=unclassified Streptomyces TaxID=2593676 RepID=UPI0015D5CE91|nr:MULTISPECIES: hypothetical protein [unclassified Streptomyces]QLJ01506.1 hypothetical protein HZZ00_11040 [Streptomyces sp. NEAU-sy36]
MYKLRYEEAVESVWDSLPDAARAELDDVLPVVCKDPWGRTEPRSEDDPRDVRRTLTLKHTTLALLIMDGPPVQRVYIRHIDYLG